MTASSQQLLQQIDQIEQSFVAEWGPQGQHQLVEMQERCIRARERLLPLTVGQRLQRFIQRAAATLLAAQPLRK